MPFKLLIADDDLVISTLLQEYLETENCTVSLASNGVEALESLANNDYDLAILDIMMPQLDGIETLKRIRKDNQLPVIMLTARGDDMDRILGLELGADDYIPKPCNPRELLARIKAVIRRSGSDYRNTETSNPRIEIANIVIDQHSRKVSISGIDVILTQTEFDILVLMATTSNRVISRQEISQKILGRDLSRWDRSIDVHVSNLRKKLDAGEKGEAGIRTIRGIGYQLILSNSPP